MAGWLAGWLAGWVCVCVSGGGGGWLGHTQPVLRDRQVTGNIAQPVCDTPDTQLAEDALDNINHTSRPTCLACLCCACRLVQPHPTTRVG